MIVIRKVIFNQSRVIISFKQKSTKSFIDIDKLNAENSADISVIDEEANQREQKLQFNCNKSGLNPSDYNKLHDKVPYPEQYHWTHGTLKYQRKMYGIYGDASGFDQNYCWPMRQNLQYRIASERIAYPNTITELAKIAQTARQGVKEQIWKRQNEIDKRIEKLEIWKQELHSRIAKKEKESVDAKARKDRLVEDVRRHFGYTVDPKSDKFKEMLEIKEKEQKKIIKEAKRKVKEEKLVEKISDGLRGISDEKQNPKVQFTKSKIQD